MGGVLLAAVLAFAAAGGVPAAVVADFAPGTDADQAAKALCLRHGCTVRHVYRYLPGAAFEGGDLAALARAPEVAAASPDLPILVDPQAYALVGAPSHAPLLVIGGGLDGARLALDRRIAFAPGRDEAAMRRTTDLVAGLARRMPERPFWEMTVLGAGGRGRLSDLLAALEAATAMRHAVGAVYAPLAVDGAPPARLCTMVEAVLRKGLLFISAVDRGCPGAFP